MTLQSSGAISLSNIASEMGGSTPHSLSEYYRGGGLTPNHSNTSNIPTSGQISFSNFYGANATAPGVANYSFTINFTGTQGLGTSYGFSSTMGSLSNNPMTTQLSTGLKINVQYAYWTSLCSKGQFAFAYQAIGGPTDGTGFSSIETNFDGTTQRSGLSISGGGNSTTNITVLRSATSSTWPTSGTQTFTIYA